jgi:hypothetical protein
MAPMSIFYDLDDLERSMAEQVINRGSLLELAC